jgi:hypothetical protein
LFASKKMVMGDGQREERRRPFQQPTCLFQPISTDLQKATIMPVDWITFNSHHIRRSCNRRIVVLFALQCLMKMTRHALQNRMMANDEIGKVCQNMNLYYTLAVCAHAHCASSVGSDPFSFLHMFQISNVMLFKQQTAPGS